KHARAGEWSEAKRAIRGLTFAPTLEAKAGLIDQIALSAYLLGQSFFTDGVVREGELARGREPEPIQIFMTAGIMAVGLEQSMEAVRIAALEVLDEAQIAEEDSKTVFKAVIPGMGSKLNTAVAGGGQAIDTAANLTTSRLASFGALAQAEALGAGTYQITEVLDLATCAVCRRMHGRKFRVGPALLSVQETLLTQNPQELATSQPWANQSRQGISDLSNMSEDQLVEKGLNRPPYHPACRGIVVPVGTVPAGQMIDFSPLASGLTASEAAAVEIAEATS
ncbi:hypothetical protein LCGC14_3048720, partial [marine sediment metagenome]